VTWQAWTPEPERWRTEAGTIASELRAGADRLPHLRIDAGLAREWSAAMREIAAWLTDVAPAVCDDHTDSPDTDAQRLAKLRNGLIATRDAALHSIDFHNPAVVAMTAGVRWLAWAITRRQIHARQTGAADSTPAR
jgi:hypothetical protein